MKINCDREQLAAAFQLAASVAPARSPKEILQNVRMTATGSSLQLSATDMEVGIRLELKEGVEIEAEGSVLMPVQRTMAILRESTDEKIRVAAVDTQIHLTTSRSKFRLPAANPDEFPQVATFDVSDAYHEIPTRLFREMVRRTVFAADADSTRYALGGVLLELEGDTVIAVGTDGRRLARMQGTGVSHGDHKTVGMTTIVPTRAISLMERAVSDSDESVFLTARQNDLLLRTPRCIIYSRLVEGRYPNWRQVFPKREEAVQIDMIVGPLFAALRQASIVADHDTRGIEFTFGNGTLKLEANTAQIGESSVEMPITYDGEEIVLKLDHRFVGDFCKVLDNDLSFIFEVESSTSPALLSTPDGYSYVIMPMARDR